MAGLPQSVIKRATEILKQLENDRDKNNQIQKNVETLASEREGMQLSFFQLEDPVLMQIRDEIAGLDINGLTPLEALNKLNEIKKITGYNQIISPFLLFTRNFRFQIKISSNGRSRASVFCAAIFSTISIPSMTSPKTVYSPSRNGVPPIVS